MINWIQALIAPIAGIFNSWNQRKQAKDSALAKLQLAKQSHDVNLQLTDTEWEALGKRAEHDGWKDDWVTIIITLPLVTIFLAAIWSAYTGDPRMIDAVNSGIAAIQSLLPNFATILEVVVYAAVSIKGIGVLRK